LLRNDRTKRPADQPVGHDGNDECSPDARSDSDYRAFHLKQAQARQEPLHEPEPVASSKTLTSRPIHCRENST
jgi:hypothetical protein